MIDSLGGLGSLATAVGVVFTLASAAWSGSLIGRIRDLRNQLKDMRSEVEDKDRREDDAKETAKELAQQLEQLKRDHESLQRTVTAKQELADLTKAVEAMGSDLREVGRMVEQLVHRGGS